MFVLYRRHALKLKDTRGTPYHKDSIMLMHMWAYLFLFNSIYRGMKQHEA